MWKKPDEFADWDKAKTHAHGILLIGADGSICAADSECGAKEALRGPPPRALSNPEGSDWTTP